MVIVETLAYPHFGVPPKNVENLGLLVMQLVNCGSRMVSIEGNLLALEGKDGRGKP